MKRMLIGDPNIFAIESLVSIAHEELSFRALGFFVIHLGGLVYGLREPDATYLACSLDEVGRRVKQRGRHTAPFSAEPDAGKIIDADFDASHAPNENGERYFDLTPAEFQAHMVPDGASWAPDGDEAFDDGSSVLHFDVADRVRLIGYRLKRCPEDYPHDPNLPRHKWESFDRYQNDPPTVRDVWLKADEFYGILQRWHDAFLAEWAAAPKPFKASGHSDEHLAEIIRLGELTKQIRAKQEASKT